MRSIKKKTWPDYFQAMLDGKKQYDFRLNDFDVAEGDELVLEEWDPATQQYTGRVLKKIVTYVGKVDLDNLFWPKEDVEKKGLQILSLK